MFCARVPASTANLGPGFDTLGIALGLYLEARLELADSDSFAYSGNGFVADTPDNLVHRGFRAVYEQLGLTAPSVAIGVTNPIPLARGLGSSSAALVAGAALADQLTGHKLGRSGVFKLTAALEGHPDNVGPCVYGGFTLAAFDAAGEFVEATLAVPPEWRLLFGVPAFELQTAQARASLPEAYSRADTVLTSSRSALWVAAIAQRRPELLRTASLDVLHQPYRARLIPGFSSAIDSLYAAGAHAAFLSGAGPTVGAICDAGTVDACLAALWEFVTPAGEVLELAAATGYEVREC